MFDLSEIVNRRHSTRMFLADKPVDRQLVTEALELATRAPSNSNNQAWRIFFTSGHARERLVAALMRQAESGAPQVQSLPESFMHLRRELGALVYGAMGIDRDDQAARRVAQLRNWEFFRAPLAGIVCVHKELDHIDSMSVGMFLQTLLLGLTARGLDSCVQVSIAHYADTVREQLAIADELRILCGLAIGYGDPGFAANFIHTPRNPLSDNVVFVDD